ncbi:MAG: proline--tRNA ligase [Brevinema sp.]
MKYSQSFIFTQKESPRDAEIESHKLMLRAGIIRKSAAGLYAWMPLGKRVLDKTIQIVKEEMDKAGALEIQPPFVTPGELWKESGRWDVMGPEMARFKDRHENDLVLGPTHEEAFTMIVKECAQSYRDLPVTLYQINTKFRDEIRPRFGVMRCREFLMKDAYSYDIDEAGLDKSYQAMRKAYLAIFQRVGLNADPVLADSGNMGGSGSEEFMVPSTVGEEDIVKCPSCGYIANSEKATSLYPAHTAGAKEAPIEKIHTPAVKTIAELESFLKIPATSLIKALVYKADGKLIMALIRGDLQACEVKLKGLVGAVDFEVAEASEVEAVMKAPVGFLGGVNCPLPLYADESILTMSDAVAGANEKDQHFIHVNVARDFSFVKTGSFHLAEKGHLCPQCKNTPLDVYKGIEVGHIFKLGLKYSDSMKLSVLDAENKAIKPLSGSYGIGVGRVIAAIIEQNCDQSGIVFPFSIAPYHVIITPTDPELLTPSEELTTLLQKQGIEVLLDDREERAGIKFKDADLIGIPLRVTVGRTFKENGTFELKIRKNGEVKALNKEEIVQFITETVKKELSH